MTKLYFEVAGVRFNTLNEAEEYKNSIGFEGETKSVFDEFGDNYYNLKKFIAEGTK